MILDGNVLKTSTNAGAKGHGEARKAALGLTTSILCVAYKRKFKMNLQRLAHFPGV
jgi:hypothetical protein